MRALVCLLLAVASLSAICGCHCVRCTDDVMDHIDDFTDLNDFHRGLDHVYCEKLDVTRWCMNGQCVRNNCR